MKFIARRPDAAYLDTHLWLPKKFWSDVQLKSSLQYEMPRTGEILTAIEDTPHHFKVPRNFLSWKTFKLVPYPVYDARFMNFPTVDFKSNVVLDFVKPEESFQKESFRALLETYDGILTLRCGAGKTVVALHTAAYVRQPILVVVNDKGLMRQWMDEITKCLGIPKNEIGQIGGDGSPFRWKGTRITVAIVNSLSKRADEGTLPGELTRYFGVIIFDEAHLMGAPYFNMAAPPFHGRRWGLTATPQREDGFDSLLQYTFGNIVYTYLKPDLKPTVYFRRMGTVLNLTDPAIVDLTHDSTGELHLGMLYGYLASIDARTDFIAADVKAAIQKDGRQALVLTHSRAMCEALALRFPEGGVVHGDVGGDERIRRIRECNPVIAIMRLGKQALDKPSLDSIYACEPFKKEGMLQQVMGRALRPFPGKQPPSIVFYEDSMIEAMYKLCMKIRATLSRWPEHKGGRIKYYNK